MQTHPIIDWCRNLAACTDVPGQTTRAFLSSATRDAHRIVIASMAAAGMQTRVDAAGNIRGVTNGPPQVIIGSHIDTVPNAGAFDGVLGVALGIALAARSKVGIEVIAFSEEEGVRFGVPFIGSRAVVGTLDRQLLNKQDAAGITVEQAIRNFGLDPTQLNDALLDTSALAYLEFHIEQGPVLESLNQSIGIVEAIAGQTRMEFHLFGASNHAGTTPMHLRRDALTGAAEWILRVEHEARNTPGLIATVGRIEAQPNAGNVIAGLVTCSLDLRHADDAVRRAAQLTICEAAKEITAHRGLNVQFRPRLDQAAVHHDPTLTAALQRAAPQAPRMVSGAGHDAMIVAPHIPSAMLFLRSPGGVSHHPDESVLADDVDAALEAGMRFLDAFSPVV